MKAKLFNENFSQDVLEDLKVILLEELRESWRKEQNPDGRKWEKRKDDLPHKILNRTGEMQNSLYFSIENNSTLTAHFLERGAYHQYGTTYIPQRKWIGFPESAERKLKESIERNLIND